ncbi:MAG TPA: ribosome-associated translation inhibitor RaiA [Bacteroidota bacterium]
MNISITARHFELSGELKNHVYTTVQKLARYFDGIIRCDIVLIETKPKGSGRSVEIALHVNGNDMVATAMSTDYFRSVDAAVQKLERQLKRYKEKRRLKDKAVVRKVRSKI